MLHITDEGEVLGEKKTGNRDLTLDGNLFFYQNFTHTSKIRR